MHIAKKMALSLTMIITLVGAVLTNVVTTRADENDDFHVHCFCKAKYLRTEEDNVYTHTVQIGVNYNGLPVYGTCVIIVEKDYYELQCKYCNETNGREFYKTIEEHSYCKENY